MRFCDSRIALTGAVALAAALVTASPIHAVAPPFPSTATTLTSTDGIVPIPDNGSLVSVMNFAGNGTVIDVDVYLEIAHPNPADLDVYLAAPSGTTITLTSDNGGGSDDVFRGTLFDDQATGTPSAPNVRNFTYTNLVATGPIQPEEALGGLVGELAAGPWALVVIDDAGGSTGTVRAWSLTISTIGGVGPSAPAVFFGTGGTGTINSAQGRTSTATVSGVGARLYGLTVSVDVGHTSSGELDMFLTAPSGKRIDLVTNIGGGNDNLYRGATFDDHAGTPFSDVTPLPADGDPAGTIVGEGALASFIGEDPSGTWTLTVIDDTAGYSGTLHEWSLSVVTATACGDGSLDAGETCDDANVVDGDGCDSNCTPTACGNGVVSPGESCDDGNTVSGDECPSTCRNGETSCSDCVDNDADGRVDATDLACEPGTFDLRNSTIIPGRGKLRLDGAGLPFPANAAGAPVTVVVTDGTGPVLCAALGTLAARGKTLSVKGTVGNGTITVKLTTKRGGSLAVRGRGLALSGVDDAAVRIGLSIGEQLFGVAGNFRPRGAGKWVYP
jgi:cysteine-rich repeat protein